MFYGSVQPDEVSSIAAADDRRRCFTAARNLCGEFHRSTRIASDEASLQRHHRAAVLRRCTNRLGQSCIAAPGAGNEASLQRERMQSVVIWGRRMGREDKIGAVVG